MSKLPTYRLTQLGESTVALECSNGQVCVTGDYAEALRFLVHSAGNFPMGVPRVVWSLPELLTCIKSLLPASAVADLEGEHHRATWETQFARYRLYHQPGKFLGIHAGGYGEETTFYELDQFFPEDQDITSIQDVDALTDELIAAFASLGIDKIDNLKSPVAVIEGSSILDDVYRSLPSPDDIPGGCMEYAVLCDAWGAWTSAYQVGYWPEGEAHGFDMTSCYPSIAIRLLSLEGAEYRHSKKMLAGAVYGFLKGTLHINPAHPFAFCSPIVAEADGLVANYVGKVAGFFTLEQVRFIEGNEMGTFTLKDGWFVFPHSGIRPLEAVMTSFYKQRVVAGDLLSQIIKRVIDGILGRLGEYHQNEPTEFTNPVYHAMLRTGASLRVGQFLIQNEIRQDELIHVNTDGFHATRQLKLPARAPIGKWRSEESEPLIVLSPDVVLEGDRCEPLLSQIRADKKALSYELGGKTINLMSLAAEQDRYFDKYPMSGGELLRKRFVSEPILLC